MSKYTTELRWAVEQKLTDQGKSNEEKNWGYIYKDIGLDGEVHPLSFCLLLRLCKHCWDGKA